MSTEEIEEIKGFFKIFKWAAGIFSLPALAAFIMILNASFILHSLESSVSDIKSKTEMVAIIQQENEILKMRVNKIEPRVETMWYFGRQIS